MLTGELPFPGNSAMAVMMALANRNPPPVNEKNPAVPAEVATLVARLLEKDASRRPGSALEVVAALDALLAQLSGSVVLPGLTIPAVPAVGTTRVPQAPGDETLMPAP